MSPPVTNKYLRPLPASPSVTVDVYDVLVAFNVTCPARAHAIKKLLCAGLRGKGDELQDLRESIQAIDRSIQLAEHKRAFTTSSLAE
jgi:hypothetical protein